MPPDAIRLFLAGSLWVLSKQAEDSQGRATVGSAVGNERLTKNCANGFVLIKAFAGDFPGQQWEGVCQGDQSLSEILPSSPCPRQEFQCWHRDTSFSKLLWEGPEVSQVLFPEKMQQPLNLNSHIPTLENFLVEGLCPWQGGWNLIIFKIPSNPSYSVMLCSEGNLRIFFPQALISVCTMEHNEPISLCMKSKRTQLPVRPGRTTGCPWCKHKAWTAFHILAHLEVKNERNVCNEWGLCQDKAHWAEDKKGIWATMRDNPHGIESAGPYPQEALESQSPHLTAVSVIGGRCISQNMGV